MIRYATALAFVLLAASFGLLLGPAVEIQAAPLLFIAAVVLTAWFSGPGPGLAAVAASTLLVDYFLVEPRFSLRIAVDELPWFITFVLCGLVGLGLSLQRRRYERELTDSRMELEQRVIERTALLHSSEERWRRLFETSSVGIALMEPGGHFLRANRALQAMLGYSETVLRTLTLSDLLAGAHGADLAQSEGGESHEELPLRRQDGRMLWVSLTLSVIPAGDQTVQLTSAVIIDVSARRRATEDWRRAQLELARSARLTTMGVMAASIAHEINQPLSAIVTNAEAAGRWLGATSPNADEARSALGRIVRDGNRAADIIRSIRHVLDPVGDEPRWVSINEVILQLVPLISSEMTSQGVTLTLDLGQDLPSVSGDPVQLQQLILNLLMNGLEAMRDGSGPDRRLTLCTAASSDEILVSVEDRGHGLPSDGHEQLFEPFFTTKPTGMGVGLAICRAVVESHGGRIWAEPAQPTGARFSFALPTGGGPGTVSREGHKAAHE